MRSLWCRTPFRSAWYGHANDVIDRFEASFAAHVGRRHAVSLPSCTPRPCTSPSAASRATAWRRGHRARCHLDRVLGSDQLRRRHAGLRRRRPGHLVPRSHIGRAHHLRSHFKLRAVIAVDLLRRHCQRSMSSTPSLCEPRGIAIIEDAAEAIGSEYLALQAGWLLRASTRHVQLSMGRRRMTTGGGRHARDSMTAQLHERVHATPRPRSADRVMSRFYERRGRASSNCAMSSLQAALGQAQLDRIDELVAGKRQIFAWYRDRLADHPLLTLNAEPPGPRTRTG